MIQALVGINKVDSSQVKQVFTSPKRVRQCLGFCHTGNKRIRSSARGIVDLIT